MNDLERKYKFSEKINSTKLLLALLCLGLIALNTPLGLGVPVLVLQILAYSPIAYMGFNVYENRSRYFNKNTSTNINNQMEA